MMKMMLKMLYDRFMNTSGGEEVKRVLRDLFPGVFKEPQRVPVRVPVYRPDRGRRREF